MLRKEWQFEVIRIGTELEREVGRLKTTLPAEVVNDREDPPQTLRGLRASFRRLGCGSGAGPPNLLPLQFAS